MALLVKNYIPLKIKIGTKISDVFASLNLNTDSFVLKTADKDMETNNKEIVINNSINEIVI